MGGENDGWFLGDSFYYSLGRAEILLIGRKKWWVIPGWFLLLFTRQGRDTTNLEEKMMGDSWVIPSTILLAKQRYYWLGGENDGWFLGDSNPTTIPALLCSRKHSLSENSNCFFYFSRNHPGSTHGWFLGDSYCDIINGA